MSSFITTIRGIKSKQQPFFLLAFLIFFLGLSLTDFIIGFLGFYDLYPSITFFPFDNPFAVLASTYLYFKSTYDNRPLSVSNIITHALAPVFFYLFHFLVLSIPTVQKNLFISNFYFPFLVYVEQLSYYILGAYYLLKIHQILKHNSRETSKTETHPIRISTLPLVYYASVVYFLIDFLYACSKAINGIDFDSEFYIYLLRGILLSTVCIVTLVQGASDISTVASTLPESKNEKYSKEDCLKLKQELLNFINTNKPYLNSNLSLNQFAQDFGKSIHTVSHIINQEFETNFNDFVNKYRIESLLEKIKDPANGHITLLGLAYDCGFNSKSTFNRAFKKVTGMTPSAYLDSLPLISSPESPTLVTPPQIVP